MNDVEDRLRDAYRAAAATVRPEAVRDLQQGGLRPHRAIPGRRRWMLPLMPLGAAAAVTALVLGGWAIVPKATSARHHAVAPRAGGGRAHSAAAAMPEFTVAAVSNSLEVFRTATGQVAGQVTAPAGQVFVGVAGAADDRTFLVTADLNPQTSCETFLYKVELSSSGQPSAPAPLPSSGVRGVLPTAVALSADGKTAAFSAVHCAGEAAGHIGAAQAIGGINLADMATGHVTRQWSYSLGEDYPSGLSLSADGSKLAFSMYLPGTMKTAGRVLSTSAPSGTVDSASRVVVHQPQGANAGVGAVAMSPDGGTVYACTNAGGTPLQPSNTLAAYNATTGQQTKVLLSGPAAAGLSCGLAVDLSGGSLLVTAVTGKAIKTPVKGHPGAYRVAGYSTTSAIAVNPVSGRYSTLPIRITGRLWPQGLAW